MTFPFFALEGCDGVGKSTIREALVDAFQRSGWPCSSVGQHSWLDPWTTRLIIDVRERRRSHSPAAIAESYLRDKQLHARNTIVPMQAASVVIADRYVVSDAVYQEVLYGIPARDTLERHRVAGTPMPTAVLYVDVRLDEAVRRIARRSKHKRHYERPADMARIISTYRRTLMDDPPAWAPPFIVFGNDAPNVRDRVENELLPLLLHHCPARADA